MATRGDLLAVALCGFYSGFDVALAVRAGSALCWLLAGVCIAICVALIWLCGRRA